MAQDEEAVGCFCNWLGADVVAATFMYIAPLFDDGIVYQATARVFIAFFGERDRKRQREIERYIYRERETEREREM